MEMSHVQPVLLLLASLFFLPALRGAVDFEYCNTNREYATVSRIEVSPPVGLPDEQTININLFGYACKNIPIEIYVYVTIRYKDGHEEFLKVYHICEVIACNDPEKEIEAGTNFELPLSDVPYVDAPDDDVPYVGSAQEIKYDVSFRLQTLDQENPIPNMCVEFKVPSPAPALVSI
ncbi:MD-2-related lipid-recognition domain [Arabidopsis suecica]|uniref:MD-2-related lipid-recognition domain n=1 Tax=Arabidopsis suecica TaxID=45249 RepID=A0A8T1ZB98_ARASU|nr:MD-2-related lipid-recognition domain [Arabidopsis suecica]